MLPSTIISVQFVKQAIDRRESEEETEAKEYELVARGKNSTKKCQKRLINMMNKLTL